MSIGFRAASPQTYVASAVITISGKSLQAGSMLSPSCTRASSSAPPTTSRRRRPTSRCRRAIGIDQATLWGTGTDGKKCIYRGDYRTAYCDGSQGTRSERWQVGTNSGQQSTGALDHNCGDEYSNGSDDYLSFWKLLGLGDSRQRAGAPRPAAHRARGASCLRPRPPP